MPDLFVISVTADRSAAVIPQDQAHPVRGVILFAEADEGRKRVGLDHAGISGVLDQALKLPVADFVNLVNAG